MYAILKNDLNKDFKFSSKRIILIEKINIFVGANNSGKSYLLRSILEDLIAIKDSDFIISEVEKVFSKLTIDNFPYQFLKDLNIRDSLISLEEVKRNIELIRSNVREDKQTLYALSYSNRKHPINFINKDEVDKAISYIYEQLGKLGVHTENRLYSRQCEDVIDKLLPDVIKHLNSWIQTDLVLKVVDNIEMTHVIEKFLDLGNMYKDLYSKYDQTKMLIPIQTVENEHNDTREKLILPVVRSLRHPFKKVDEVGDFYKNDPYKNRYLSEYKISENYIEVFSGLDLYQRYKTSLLGTIHERDSIRKFELFLSNMFFENKKVSIIPDERSHELKINIEGDADRPLYNVGDGLSSLIILFFNLFVGNSSRKIFFIEEPEQNMHPGLQRLFMETISNSSYFDDYYFFFTTHSNHIIDTSINNFDKKRLFHVEKRDDVIEITSRGNSAGVLLDSLGVQPSSLFLSNSAIWVEGKYDALFLRELLEWKYNQKNEDTFINKRYIEGIDYVFVPYAGSNRTLIDFSCNDESNGSELKDFILEAIKINRKFMFILDDDGINNGREGKKADFYKDMINTLDDKVYKLDAMEIENIAPKEVVIDYAVSEIKKNIAFKYYAVEYTDKDVTEFLKSSIQYKGYKNKKLYDYLNLLIISKFGKENLKIIVGTVDGFKTGSSLKNKSKFFEKFKEVIQSDRFNPTTASSDLLEKVYLFISK